ncbi:hypothetical protein D3C76_1588560 [compost metagenome]
MDFRDTRLTHELLNSLYGDPRPCHDSNVQGFPQLLKLFQFQYGFRRCLFPSRCKHTLHVAQCVNGLERLSQACAHINCTMKRNAQTLSFGHT